MATPPPSTSDGMFIWDKRLNCWLHKDWINEKSDVQLNYLILMFNGIHYEARTEPDQGGGSAQHHVSRAVREVIKIPILWFSRDFVGRYFDSDCPVFTGSFRDVAMYFMSFMNKEYRVCELCHKPFGRATRGCPKTHTGRGRHSWIARNLCKPIYPPRMQKAINDIDDILNSRFMKWELCPGGWGCDVEMKIKHRDIKVGIAFGNNRLI